MTIFASIRFKQRREKKTINDMMKNSFLNRFVFGVIKPTMVDMKPHKPQIRDTFNQTLILKTAMSYRVYDVTYR